MTTQEVDRPNTFTGFVIPTRPAISNGNHPGGKPAYVLTPEIEEFIVSNAKESCSEKSIALSLGIDVSVFHDNQEYSNAFKKGRAEYLLQLHKEQHHLATSPAVSPNVRALETIWLGKQDLGQRDSSDAGAGGPVQVRIILEGLPVGVTEQVTEGEVRVLPAGETETK